MASSSAKPWAIPLWVDILPFHLEHAKWNQNLYNNICVLCLDNSFCKILSVTFMGKYIRWFFDLKAVRETKNRQIPKRKEKKKQFGHPEVMWKHPVLLGSMMRREYCTLINNGRWFTFTTHVAFCFKKFSCQGQVLLWTFKKLNRKQITTISFKCGPNQLEHQLNMFIIAFRNTNKNKNDLNCNNTVP